MIKDAPAFLSFRDDIKNRDFFDWIEAHTSLMKPLYRYKGMISIDREKLSFFGHEKKTGLELQIIMYRNEIQQLYLGYDDVFTILETRNLGLIWKPLRISFIKEGLEYQVYLITNYSFGHCDNDIWMEILKEWLG